MFLITMINVRMSSIMCDESQFGNFSTVLKVTISTLFDLKETA